MSGDDRHPPHAPPPLSSMPVLIGDLEQQIVQLRAIVAPEMGGLVSYLERLVVRLRMIDGEDRLALWLESVRTDPSTRQTGLSYRAILSLPSIRQQTLMLFRDRHGAVPTTGPLDCERCIHPAMRAHIYIRYVAYYGGMPNNRQVPLYFGMQLTAEFILGHVVDYHDRRPGAGLGVGRMQDQDRRPGDLAHPPPPSRRRRTEPTLVPLSSVQTIGLEIGLDLQAATTSIQHLVHTFRPSFSVHTKPYGLYQVILWFFLW